MSPTPNIPSGGGADDFSQRIAAERSKMSGQQDAAEQAAQQVQDQTATQPGDTQKQAGDQSTGPVGQGDYVVREGECISSIAKEHGLFWESIWNDPANAELRAARKSPNVLLAGDRVTIPDKERKDEPLAPEQRHRFVRRGEPSSLNVRFTSWDEPFAGAPYKAYIDGKLVQEGALDGNGGVEMPVDSNARKALFVITDEYGEESKYEVQLRKMPPVSELCGVHDRLDNLGFPCGRKSEDLTAVNRLALKAFQREHGLPITGEPDKTTRAKIEKLHGC